MAHTPPLTRPGVPAFLGAERTQDVLLTAVAVLAAAGAVVVAQGGAAHRLDVHNLQGHLTNLALGVAATVPLAWRRRAPLVVLGLTGAAAIAGMVLFGSPGPAAFGPLIALYTVAASCERAVSLTAGWVTLCGAVVGVTVERTSNVNLTWEEFALPAVFIVIAWLIGDNLRVRRAYVAQLEERSARAEADRIAAAERAAAVERARIARELHDVVAHHVSVIAIQAGAARLLIEGGPPDHTVFAAAAGPGVVPAGHEALESIEAMARQALTELRRMLGVLRRDAADETPALEPQPGIGSLQALIETVRKAGLPVEWRIEGERVPIASSIELSAYRIIQEALTNVLKHEGPARTEVVVRFGEDQLAVVVVNQQSGAPHDSGLESGGHGIAGMRERVALFGGDLDVGRRPDGAFSVVARLPFEAGPQ